MRVTDHSGTTPLTYEERAPIIISGIGARETYQHLLPTTGPTGGLTARVREQIASLGHGGSAVTVYLTLDHYPHGHGPGRTSGSTRTRDSPTRPA